MRGFFEIDIPKTPQRKSNRLLGCDGCGLYKEVKSPKMPYTGEGRLKTFILGEGPGQVEDRLNKQLVGDSGQLLRTCLKELGFDLDLDFWKQNAVRCRPTDNKGNNRMPTKNEIQCCLPLWRREVEALKPNFIILLGGKAVEAFFGDRSQPITSDLSIGRWSRTCVPDVKTNAWIISLYHPAYIKRNPDFESKFRLDLKWGLDQLKREPPTFLDWREFVIKVTTFDELMDLFADILNFKPPIIIDYETSSLRPYIKGHHIWSMSVYPLFDEEENDEIIKQGNPYSYSFPYSYPNHWTAQEFERITIGWKRILADPEIFKIAQSIQFEEIWNRRIFKQPAQGWIHDTMVCSHLINEHRKFTSLDFQVFINWGYEYGENITPFKSDDENGFNHMHEVPLPQLLEYGGLDGLFEGMLYQKQVEIIGG